MAKSPDIGNGQSADGAANVTMAAPSKRSRKSASKPVSKGPTLSNRELINIVMNGLNELQERFGKMHVMLLDGPDEPTILVLPKTLRACQDMSCGRIIESQSGAYCDLHRPKPDPMLGPVVKNTAYVGGSGEMPKIAFVE